MANKQLKRKKSAKRRRKPAVMDRQKPWVGRHNYVLNSQTILRDAYRLLCIILADESIARMSENEHDPLAKIRDQFIEDEFVHLLISISVMNRAQDDHMYGPRTDESELGNAPLRHDCGQLIENITKKNPKEKSLSLREACNKVIHADQILANPEKVKDGAFPGIPKTILLQGRLGKTIWQAKLNVPEYIRGTFKNFQDF